MIAICEIFKSIQGETTFAGFPSLFIRLSGCNLNCRWCDTPYARKTGITMTIDEILEKIQSAGWFHHITITGGEPLLQESTPKLINRLLEKNFSVQVETNGSLDISKIPRIARRIVDVKPPSSGEHNSFYVNNLHYLSNSDELKIPIADEHDFDFAKNFIEKHKSIFDNGITVNLTPVSGKMIPAALAKMMLNANIKARLNLQIHLHIWPNGEPKMLH
ncbi:MAG: radical SAM protein [Spirochaetes bacterium]|nr:radical SAM protein [Spirochaetota bacterium]